MVQKVTVKRESEAGLCHAMTGKLSLSTLQQMGTFFILGKDNAARGEMDGLCLSLAVPKIQWDSNSHCPYAIRLWETSILP